MTPSREELERRLVVLFLQLVSTASEIEKTAEELERCESTTPS
jgi:hypothetical protein